MVYLAIKRDAFNKTEDNSFDKDIPDADSKKITHIILNRKKNMHGNT